MADTTRIALVTGGNKGIGLEIVRQLAQAGASVIIGARDAGRGAAAVAELSSAGLQVRSVPLDLNDHASIDAAAARIVNLSSSLGSLSVNGDPTSPYYSARLIGHDASKAAVNMLTVQLAAELRDTPHVINSVSPGYVKTDLTGHNGFMTPEEGAKLPVKYALLGADAVSGRFVEASGETPWS